MDDIQTLSSSQFPPLLTEINDSPAKLYIRGALPPEDHVLLAVVGSRRYSNYGKEACEHLIAGLAGYPISIISGLALGIDALAHRAALKAGLHTIAIPGSGLSDDALYPASNRGLARDILSAGGALLSEFEPDFRATQWSFPQRNRIMAGLSQAVLIIEASEKSGTLITARLALDYNRDVIVVPGSIFSDTSRGALKLLKDGANAVMHPRDILSILGFSVDAVPSQENLLLSSEEERVLLALAEPLSRDDLIRTLGIPIRDANIILSAMELRGLIKESLGLVMKL
ncbi:MAG: DNA-processing protein DprA [Patescibacteria group bacterium]